MRQAQQLDHVFRALSDGGRRAMLERLSRGPAPVSELAEPLDMSLSAVLQHVQVLEDAGLVTSRKVGRVRTCRMNVKPLRPARAWIQERQAQWEHHLDALGRYLDKVAT